jgi:hypothetical protein
MSTLLAAMLVGTLILMGCTLVLAAPPQQYYGPQAGTIRGYVTDVNGRPYDWAIVYAKNVQHTYQAYSGYDGAYLMRVPVGVYNVTVNANEFSSSPTKYYANSAVANVTDGSTVRIDFHFQESPTPIPEFQPNIIAVTMTLALVTILIRRRRLSKR